MTTEAHIAENWPGMAVDITIARRNHDGSITILVPSNSDDQFDQWVDLPPATVPPISYRFPNDVAKALLDALLDHYRGGHDARQLRKDYDHERGRVDKLIDSMISTQSISNR